jgi:hypothetical protein
MTGVTVPATAGYYGADEQSLTKWKRAGGSMLQWQSDDIPNTFFMGATFETDAFKTVTVSDCDPAFNGTYIYSLTTLAWKKGTTHTLYKAASIWTLTDGVTTYTAPDNGLNTPPSSFARTLDYPLTITVSGAGFSGVNGEYVYAGASSWKMSGYETVGGGAIYKYPDSFVVFYADSVASSSILYANYDISETYPQKTGWVSEDYFPPAPTLEYSIDGEVTAATITPTTTAAFASNALAGTWIPLTGSTGTPVYSEYTIGEAWDSAENNVFFSLRSFIGSATGVIVGGWNMAEETVFEGLINYIETATSVIVGGWNMAELTVFESLAAYLGNTEDKDCFRGYIPVNEDGQPKFANVWKITSGGSAGAFNIERTYGEAGAWCNELINAEIEGLFENRTTAMHFCGAVTAWLKETQNMNKYGNVTWCRLRDLPEPPVEKIVLNKRYWQIKIPLEILFLTESVHGD